MAIRLLPPEVADAIAAGEVIERPASVVKELLENALDAGAGSITVEVRGAGRTVIRVTDDGSGIAEGELELAFRRHATSKVEGLSDLEAIATLGFRGEALASIAAVSDVECSSSHRRLRLRAGLIVEEGVAPSLPGTVFEIRDLFANTPARLKFMKSEATEQSAVGRTVAAYALCYPKVRFRLTMEGRVTLSTRGDGELRHAVEAVHGQRSAVEMMAAGWDDPEASIRVQGMVSQPRLSRGTRDAILLSVNRRPVTSRPLAYALEECYRGRLERGRYPVAVLNVDLPPGSIDVNVHPAKREVRFRDEGAVFASVQRAVRAALSESAPYVFPVPEAPPAVPIGREVASSRISAMRQMELREPAAPVLSAVPPPSPPGPDQAEAPLRPLGQIQDGYLVAEGSGGLVLVDQHAAHERVLFNLFLARLDRGEVASQALLLPVVIDLEARQLAAAADHRAQLRGLGFEYEEFGPGSLRLLAAPVETPPNRCEGSLVEILSLLAEGRKDRLHDVAASLACHSAVRFGDHMELSEQRRLLLDLESASESITCPHGRPTRLMIGWQDLKRHFRRNY